MKQLTRDEFGYVNGRGRSQYWGVTVASDPNGRDAWVVSYKPADGTETHSLRAASFTLTERDAARVAAAVYETGQKRPATIKLKILSVDKKWVYGVRGNELWRERYTTQAVYEAAPMLTLDAAQAPVVAVKRGPGRPRKEATVGSKVNDAVTKIANRKITRKNKGDAYTARLAKMILDGHLTARSSKALIAVLESTMKK